MKRNFKFNGYLPKTTKRSLTNKNFLVDLTKIPVLSEKEVTLTNVIVEQVNTSDISYNSGWFGFSKNIFWDCSDFLTFFSNFSNATHISKIKPLISDLHLDGMLARINYLSLPEWVDLNTVTFRANGFTFIPNRFTLESYLLDLTSVVFNSTVFHFFSLCATVYIMQTLSSFICTDKKSYVFTYLCNKIIFFEKDEISPTRHSIINIAWFINSYTYIMSLISWFDNYLYNNSYNKLYKTILSKIYNNIRHLMVKFYFDLALSKVKLVLIKPIFTLHVLFRFKISFFAGANLNVLYASLTLVYVIVGWLLDFISYLWVAKSNGMKWINISSFLFWIKRFFYGTIYIMWLYLGIFTTNGVYFSLFNRITSKRLFNIITTVVGSVMASISSSVWFTYANPTIFKPFTSLRRSIVEWLAFLGMVFSTYATWSFYTYYVFNLIAIYSHFLIWSTSSLISGLLLVYLEDTRPRFALYFYGVTYLFFWTCICFSTNSLVVGYINIENGASVLTYIIPINFLLAFIYAVPLYRYNSDATIFSRLFDLLLFVLLTGTTLVSGGNIWYFLAPLP